MTDTEDQLSKQDTPAEATGACPYHGLGAHAFWSKAVAKPPSGEIDPVVSAPFRISPSDRIATAGSCFAQNLARRLGDAGYNHMVAEAGYPRMGETFKTKFNYGTFSARTGNIYTARQLVQLFDRAYGAFTPVEPFWINGRHWMDPFRPFIQPLGFETRLEAELDRTQHLGAVRNLMETLDVFIFTLGLTEAWLCKADGAVLPVCPGCGAGAFDPERYAFKNFEVEEITADLLSFSGKLRSVNPRAKIVLTVSPVPLVATFSGSHVLSATTYSKSALRVAADRVSRSLDNCMYFPSYEIVTSSANHYFTEGLRNVSDEGIDHVMRVFFHHVGTEPSQRQLVSGARPAPKPVVTGRSSVLDDLCDEYVSLHMPAGDR